MQLPEHFLSDGTSSTTFSILVRIDPHAAHRYDCRRRNSSRLSVSSCGSTLMQHTAISGRRDAPMPFSILVRIDPHAAMIYQKRCSSSYIFQYPRADRPSCSPGLCYCHSPLLNLLSVSSCGSTLMQPKYWPRRTVWHALTFSILVRIDPHAACSASLVCGPTARIFQYPRADRPSCSQKIAVLFQQLVKDFQYPRADRPSCSPPAPRQTANNASTFQYPRADRPSCSRTATPVFVAVQVTFSILVRIDPHAAI